MDFSLVAAQSSADRLKRKSQYLRAMRPNYRVFLLFPTLRVLQLSDHPNRLCRTAGILLCIEGGVAAYF
jgi:hypothetical protein